MPNLSILPRSPRGLSRLGIGFALAALCLWLVLVQFQHVTAAAVTEAMGQVPLLNWGAALAATTASYAAIARYDVIAHRHLRTGVPTDCAARSGAVAVALTQSIGFGLATGTAARWRLLPGLGLARTTQVTMTVSLTFMTALSALILLFNPLNNILLSAFGLIALLAVGLVLTRNDKVPFFNWHLTPPSLPACTAFFLLTLTDTVLATLALSFLLPTANIAPMTLFSAYLLALGAGLISGTPGGLGPFELTLALLLPQVPAQDLGAALIAYRLVYHLVPLSLALPALLQQHAPIPSAPASPPLPKRADLPEYQIAQQNGAIAITTPTAMAAAFPLAQSIVLFRAPLSGPLAPMLVATQRHARLTNRVACAYKLNARNAVHARAMGWTVLPLCNDAILNPAHFTLEAPECRQLRRQLRKARNAGVTTKRITLPDWQAMSRINTAWVQTHGPEHGLTMGRFDPAYLSHQTLYGAYRGSQLIAFLTVLPHRDQPIVDLMRSLPSHPPGTMQALILHALSDARSAGATLNLAATPAAWLNRRSKSRSGLIRFKASFAPTWQPLYIAAPNPMALCLAAWDIWRTLRRPPQMTQPQHDDEDYAFDSLLCPCEMEQQSHVTQTGYPDDQSSKPALGNTRLADGRWRHWDQPIQHGSGRGRGA